MNTPIISPLWFYLIGTIPKVAGVLADISLVLFIFCGVVIFVVVLTSDDNDEGQAAIKRVWTALKKKLIVAVILLSLSNVIPSKEVCYQMAAASLITPANIGATKETAKEAIDYVIDSIDILLEENTQDKESD